MASFEKDLNVFKALAWFACDNLTNIWSSKLSRNFRIRLFRATVETVLLYSETWTVNKALNRKLMAPITRMLHM